MLLDEVCALCKISKATIHRRRVTGAFPQPVKTGRRSIAWKRDEIDAWAKDELIKNPPYSGPGRMCKKCLTPFPGKICKKCHSEAKRKLRNENPERYKSYRKKWCEENPEKRKLAQKNWQQKNRERHNEASRKTQAALSLGLSDVYVAKTLGMSIAECPPHLISAKRDQLQIHRLTQQLTEALNEATKGESK